MKQLSESQRVMGFKYKKPSVKLMVSFDAAGYGNIKYKLMDLLDDMNVSYESVEGGKSTSNFNSYTLNLNIYDEKEAEAIINDLHVKLMVDGIRISDVVHQVHNPEMAEGRLSVIKGIIRQVIEESL